MKSPQVMYDQPSAWPIPRSLNSNSKLENLRGISNKLFGRKGSIGTESSSPVDNIPILPPSDDYSPFSSRNSMISFHKAPPTPPHAHTSPSQSTFSSSPSARSLSTTASSHKFSDCCFCDIPLKYVIGTEDIVEFACTHLAHFECLLRLSEVLNKSRACTKSFRLPACGVCDEPSCFVEDSLFTKFNQTMASILALKPASPATSPRTAEPPQVPPKSARNSANSRKSYKCPQSSCQGLTSSIQFFTQLDRELPQSGPATAKCLIGMSVPNNVFYHNFYASSPSDDVKFYNQISKLKRLSFKGVSLNRLDMSHIRLVNNYKVSSDLCNWSNCTVYLLPESLILTAKSSDGTTQIKAVIDTKSHLASAKILGRGKVPYIEIVIKSLQKSKLYVICDEIDPLEALCAALHNDKLMFPIHPDENDSHVMNVPHSEGEALYRAPLNIVVCIEQPHTPQQAGSIVVSLKALRDRMSPMDRLAIVLYGSTLRSFGFQPSNSSTWPKLDDTLQKLGTPNGTIMLDKSIDAAEELLRNLRIENSLACVMVINSTPASHVSSICPGFIYSNTPIHTIGIEDGCDFASLSNLSAKTDGISIACTPSALSEKVTALYDLTSSRTHKNVEVKLTPTEGVRISKVTGWDMALSAGKLSNSEIESTGTDLVYSIKTDADTSSQSIPVGSMYEGSSKSFIVELEIDDCSTFSDSQILQTTIFSRAPQSISHHRCTLSNPVRAEFGNDNTDFVKRQATLDACEFARELALLLTNGQHKDAFCLIQSEKSKFAGRYDIFSDCADIEDSLKSYLLTLDRFFDEFSDKLFQPRSALTGELFNFIWIHSAGGFISPP